MAQADGYDGAGHRPSLSARNLTAPPTSMNGHFATQGATSKEAYKHGVQVIDEDKNFNDKLNVYLSLENVADVGFNYHLISVFGSQSTGKSTLLNYLFGTQFGTMSETERKQTTKGIWMSKNKKQTAQGGAKNMADNILVMDVEGTDGRERGEDQDFERKAALFALATSEVLLVNIWETQVGLYQGANMALLKTVFEVNVQLFLKDRTVPRSLLFFVIRDHPGTTPLQNLQDTLMKDLTRIWTTISKPPGLEHSQISDYFDFAFAALPHKIFQTAQFEKEVENLGQRFSESSKTDKLGLNKSPGVFQPEYHRRIPADGFSHYASGIWDQIVNNKDLDLPTQQELLAQFRCDEIARELLIVFDQTVVPLESQQADAARQGKPILLTGLGASIQAARQVAMQDFETQAGRYHKAVFKLKLGELIDKVDSRLKALVQSQLTATHKIGIKKFTEAVTESVRAGQKQGSNYDFAQIVASQKGNAVHFFISQADELAIDNAQWSDGKSELKLFEDELDEVSARLRKDEMRRLATRIERLVRTKLADTVGFVFNSLGSNRAVEAETEDDEKTPQASEKDLWDRIWTSFTEIVTGAEERFTKSARGFDASPDEVDVGLWRLRRRSWGALRSRLEEEVMEGNILLKLRENFEDKFRYDESGVPRIWRPTDDIETIYTTARASTLSLIPLLSQIHLTSTSSPPPLDDFVGSTPPTAGTLDEEDLPAIGGVDDTSASAEANQRSTLEEEATLLTPTTASSLATRFKKTADGVFIEAKRSAIGGITQVPLYFYGLLLLLGWNELVAVLRNPLYFIFLILLGAGAYVAHTLNLWGPMIRMGDAAAKQALEVGKERLRDFLEQSEASATARDKSSGLRRRTPAKDEDDEEQ